MNAGSWAASAYAWYTPGSAQLAELILYSFRDERVRAGRDTRLNGGPDRIDDRCVDLEGRLPEGLGGSATSSGDASRREHGFLRRHDAP